MIIYSILILYYKFVYLYVVCSLLCSLLYSKHLFWLLIFKFKLSLYCINVCYYIKCFDAVIYLVYIFLKWYFDNISNLSHKLKVHLGFFIKILTFTLFESCFFKCMKSDKLKLMFMKKVFVNSLIYLNLTGLLHTQVSLKFFEIFFEKLWLFFLTPRVATLIEVACIIWLMNITLNISVLQCVHLHSSLHRNDFTVHRKCWWIMKIFS